MIWVIIAILGAAIVIARKNSDNTPGLKSETPAGQSAEVADGCVKFIICAVLVLAFIWLFVGATAQYTLPQDAVERMQSVR